MMKHDNVSEWDIIICMHCNVHVYMSMVMIVLCMLWIHCAYMYALTVVLNDDIPSDDVPADDIPMETPPRPRSHSSYPSISFLQALLVPGVIEFSMCLFFSKLVTYSFTVSLIWMYGIYVL